MRKECLVLIPLLAAASMLTASILAVRIFMGQPSQDRLARQEHVDITTLRPPLPPPSFLACPPDYCAAAGNSVPIFAMPWLRLHEVWAQMIARQPRIVRIAEELDGRRLVYIQHSSLFRFPDIITVEFVPLGPDRSSLALYSRSRYGHYDFRQNRRRIETWLARLSDFAAAPVAHPGAR
ncbi:MAG: DUF1499 domain-containing protein [Alphaproteobacteria bacterium]|nr:DUF1499 domain-containing protein [Alphaproteobacteria bacterium]